MITCETFVQRPMVVPVPGAWLHGSYCRPEDARGLVVIGMGADTNPQGRKSNALAGDLNAGGLATLTVDLLDPEERADPDSAFDSQLLTERWMAIAAWLRHSSPYVGWNIGLYASGVPAAGALMAAARHPEDVQAVVTRNGRTDLAENWLPLVEAPTLFLVDRGDEDLAQSNHRAVESMDSLWRLVEVTEDSNPDPRNSHQTSRANFITRNWFSRNLRCGDSWG